MSFNNTTDAEALAEEVLTVADWRKMDAAGLSADEFLKEQHGVDPAEHTDADELHAAVLSARKLNGDPDHKGTNSGDDESGIPDETSESSQMDASVGADTRFEYGDSEEEIAALSATVLTVSDLRQIDAAGLTEREYLEREHGVDVREFRDESSLRDAIEEARS